MKWLGSLGFIIFGSKLREKDCGRVYPAECPHCNNECYYRAVKMRRWHHIYWIPLIPRQKDYRIECPVCQMGISTSKEGFKAAKQMSEITRRNLDGEITSDEYDRQLRRFHSMFSTEGDGDEIKQGDVPQEEIDDNVDGLRDRHEDSNRGFE